MSEQRVKLIKRADREQQGVVQGPEYATMGGEDTRALFLEMRRLMIRLCNSIERAYDLRESHLKSE